LIGHEFIAATAWQDAEKVRDVIPGHAEGANPETRSTANSDVSGFLYMARPLR
jgi:hypothetical protein